MRKLLVVLAMVASVALPVGIATATPPSEPPGQGECSHGNSGASCVPDPSENGQDCLEHGNEGGVNEDHCVSPPPPTPTEPPPTSPPPCVEENGRTCTESPPPPTSPPPTSPPPTTRPPRPTPSCEPSVTFSRWIRDPMINITLTGPAQFRVTGGLQRSSGIRRFNFHLDCNETFTITRYKVHGGELLFVYVDGALRYWREAPELN